MDPNFVGTQSDETAQDEYFRYIAYLQRSQIQEGWEDFLENPSWDIGTPPFEAARKTLLESSGEADDALQEEVNRMLSTPVVLTTPFESRMTTIRYRPILDEIIEAANDLGLAPVRPIDIVTSTDISCTPVARPTNDRHLLFAGEGTARFCNYWTKAISRVVSAMKALDMNLSETDRDADLLAESSPGMALAAVLATQYAFKGTLLRFMRVPDLPEEADWRFALLLSMYQFSVAHEYAHFAAYETRPETHGILSEEESQNLELWCDRLAIKICRHIGKQKKAPHIRAGLGAIAFFRVLQICHLVEDLYVTAGLISTRRASSDGAGSHPTLDRRIEALVGEIFESADLDEKDDIEYSQQGLFFILKTMERVALQLIEQTLTLTKEQRQQIFAQIKTRFEQ
jgi:hypothetical protein